MKINKKKTATLVCVTIGFETVIWKLKTTENIMIIFIQYFFLS